MINKNTQLFLSLSSNPGNFGATLYNTAFQELGIDAIYKPLGVAPYRFVSKESFFQLIEGLSKMGVAGVSISSPYKKDAYYASSFKSDKADPAYRIKNTNTLKFENARLYPYNTDCVGFERACQYPLKVARSAVLYGNGALADSIKFMLFKHKIAYCIVGKEETRFPPADWLINASPVGMPHVSDRVFTEEVVEKYAHVFDCVVDRETKLISLANKLGKQCINGVDMCLEQLCAQFKIYIEREAPRDLFIQALKEGNYV